MVKFMELQRLYSKVRQAIDDYHMIEEGDTVAIGISGGKDSLALLYALAGLRNFYPMKFQLKAITVSLGYQEMDFTKIKALCEQLQVPYDVLDTEIADIVFHQRQEVHPCSLCAKLRKGALNKKALELGCNKVAYAHHMDDVVETLFMSMMYESRMRVFRPVTHLDKTGLTVIRPCIYLKESEIIGFRNKMLLPVVKNQCPVDGHTKREYVKTLLSSMNKDNKGVKDRIFQAIVHDHISGY